MLCYLILISSRCWLRLPICVLVLFFAKGGGKYLLVLFGLQTWPSWEHTCVDDRERVYRAAYMRQTLRPHLLAYRVTDVRFNEKR